MEKNTELLPVLDDLDQRLLGHLLAGGNINGFAKATGKPSSTIYQRANRPSFVAAMAEAAATRRAEIASQYSMTVSAALECLREIMQDNGHNGHYHTMHRLKACEIALKIKDSQGEQTQ